MQYYRQSIAVGVVMICLGVSACATHSEARPNERLAKVELIQGSDLSRVTLSDKAMVRIDLKTDLIREQQLAPSPSPRKVVPYGAVIYDPQGNVWVYTNPQPRTFVRSQVVIDYIDGDVAVLTEGPPVDTLVASVGAAELHFIEFEGGL